MVGEPFSDRCGETLVHSQRDQNEELVYEKQVLAVLLWDLGRGEKCPGRGQFIICRGNGSKGSAGIYSFFPRDELMVFGESHR